MTAEPPEGLVGGGLGTIPPYDLDGDRVAYARAGCAGRDVVVAPASDAAVFAPGDDPCGARLRPGRTRLRGRHVRMRVSCEVRCRGSLLLERNASDAGRGAIVDVAAGRTRALSARLRRGRVLRRLRRGHRVALRAVFLIDGLAPAVREVVVRRPRGR